MIEIVEEVPSRLVNGANNGHRVLGRLYQLLKQFHDQRAGGRVKASRGLIEDQYVGRLKELQADGEPLLLAARASSHASIANGIHAEHGDELVDSGLVVKAHLADVLQTGGKVHRLHDRQRHHQVVVLRDKGDASIADVF